MDQVRSPDPRLARARFGTTMTFGLAAAMVAIWTVRIPALSDKLDLGPSELGLTVLAWGIGALITMQATRGWLARAGSHAGLRIVTPASAATLSLLAAAPSYPLLIVAAAVFGMVFGVLDVAMNAQAASIERASGRHLMNGMHAGWSIGAVAGGVLGAGTAAIGWGFSAAVYAMSALAFPVSVLLARTYLPDAAEPATRGAPRPRLPRLVYLLGAVAFAAFMVEGSVADWSSLYLYDELAADEAVAALAYPAFESGMIAGRLAGDRVRTAVGDRRLMGGAGLAAAAAFTLVMLAPAWWVGLVGFTLVGVSVSTIVPLTFSLAGSAAGSTPAAGIAQATTLGYAGLLIGPVVIGVVAEETSLRSGFALVVALTLAIALAARILPRGPGPPASGRPGPARLIRRRGPPHPPPRPAGGPDGPSS